MSAATPGQAAYEAWAESHTLNGDDDWQPWSDVDADGHEIWEGIAQAARVAQEPHAAPELAAAMTESRLRAEVITEILDAFSPSGSGHTARVGMVQIAKWRTRAGLTS